MGLRGDLFYGTGYYGGGGVGVISGSALVILVLLGRL